MGTQVVNGAVLTCTFGMAPATLQVLPANNVLATTPAANTQDHKPMVNIPAFGACQSLSNPTVASATAAALGVLTPMPCVPATTAPWAPGSPTVLIGGQPALESNSKCMCNWGGVIAISVPGQLMVQTA